MTREEWAVKPDGKGAFSAVFEMFDKGGKSYGGGTALSGLTEEQAEAHCARARSFNAERVARLALVDHLFDKENWKLPVRATFIEDETVAYQTHEALGFFCGGAEIRFMGAKGYRVSSRGYFHYCGA